MKIKIMAGNGDTMDIEKYYLPALVTALILLACAVPASAGTPLSNLNAYSRIGSLPESSGTVPSIPEPGSVPSEILPAYPFTPRTISLSSLTITIQRFHPDDYTSPVLPADNSNSIPRFTWEDLFTPPPKFCGCGGCS
jgi:hypothetical protein